MASRGDGRSSLAMAGLSAALASVCCLGPLVLLMLGVSGAWIGNLAVLEPYRPWFIGVAVIALSVAGRRIFRPAPCAEGDFCAAPRVRTTYVIGFWIVAALVLVALAFPYAAPFFY